MLQNGQFKNGRTGRYSPRDEIRLPDERWIVGGDSEIEASVWVARGGNEGQEYLDLRRITSKDGQAKTLKTFRRCDIWSYYLGLAEHAARISEDESLSESERDVFAQLSEATVDLLDRVPNMKPKQRRIKRKRNGRS